MLSLIRKDLRAIAMYAIILTASLGMTLLVALLAGSVFLFAAFGITAVLIATPISLDWGARAGGFVHSLPVRRSDIVRARYATSLLLGLTCIVVCGGATVLFGWVAQSYGRAWPVWISLGSLLAFIVTTGVYISLLLACEYRFGSGIGGAVAATAAILFAPLALSTPGLRTSGEMVASAGPVLAALVALGAVGVMIWLSMQLAVRAHERREF